MIKLLGGVESFLLKGNTSLHLKIPLVSLSFLEVCNHSHPSSWASCSGEGMMQQEWVMHYLDNE